MQTRPIAFILAFAVAVAAAAQPSGSLDRRLDDFRKQTRVKVDRAAPVDERVYVDGGAFAAINHLSLDDSGLENHVLRQYDLTGYGRLSLDGGVADLFIRGRASFRNFNEGDVFGDSDNNDWDEVLERGFVRFDVSRFLGAYRGEEPPISLRFKVGRDFNYWANGLVLAQTLDGLVLDLDSSAFQLQLLAAATAPDAVVDIDTSRPDFNTETHRLFFGGMGTLKLQDHRPFFYVLTQRDRNNDRLTLTSPAIPDLGGTGEPETIQTRYDYNSVYVGLGSSGPITQHLAYSVELVGEFGSTLSNSFDIIPTDGGARIVQADQERDNIEAYALDISLDYAPPVRYRPRLSLEALIATGDDDRGHPTNTFDGNTAGTTDRSFNAFGLINTGLAFAPEPTNLLMLRAGASAYPFASLGYLEQLQVGVDLYAFGKYDPDAAIAEPTTGDRYLGFEPDIFLNWQMTSDISLAIRYGIFFPGDAIENDERPRQFFFAGLTFAM